MIRAFTNCSSLLLALFLMVGTSLQAQDVYWTEDFTDSLDGWTTQGLSAGNPVWTWDAEGDAAEGAFWGTLQPIQSPTGSTGAAVFNSDFYDNGGDDTNLGGGPIPAPHISELISPAIDLSGVDVANLQFYQFYRNFQSSTYVSFSYDGGATWTSPSQLNTGVSVNNATDNPDLVIIPIYNDGTGTDQFHVKFTFDGDYYFWIVDDISIIGAIGANLEIGDFFYPPASFATPASMIGTDTMGFSVDISNTGDADATNMVIKATVTDDLDNVLFEDSLVVANFPAGIVDSTYDLPNTFVPAGLPVGSYFINYSVRSDETDVNPANNEDGSPFQVTDILFAKESRRTTGYRLIGDPPPDWKVGNLYTTSSALVDDYEAVNAQFTVSKNADDGPLEGSIVSIFLVEVLDSEVDAEFDNFETGADIVDNPGLAIVGASVHEFTNETNNQLINVSIEDLNTFEPGVALKPGTRYFLLASYEGNNTVIFHGFNSADFQYFQISTIIYSSDDRQWYLGGFGPEDAAVMRMEIGLVTTTDNVPLPENAMKVFPNPVKDVLNLEIDLEEVADVANLTIADITGKVLILDELQNIQRENLTYNLSNFPAGSYFVRLATQEGTRTMKVLLQH